MDENCGEVHVKVQVREANRKRKRNSRCGRLTPKAGKTILVLDGSGLCQNTFLRLNRLNRFGRVEWQEMHPKPLQDASNRICKALATIAWWVQVEGLLQETVTFFHIMCTMKILRGIDISMWYSISSNSSFLISRICWQLMPSSAELEKRWGASCGPIYKHPASWMCDISGVIRSPVFGSKQHMYGNFEGFPLKKCIVWVGNVMTALLDVMNVIALPPYTHGSGRLGHSKVLQLLLKSLTESDWMNFNTIVSIVSWKIWFKGCVDFHDEK